MPAPASIVLREFGSPVPAHTCCVSEGAIASMPIEITRLSSNTGRHVMPLFMLFQMPPPAAATKSVLDGPGMPTTSDTRPMKLAGPTLRHLSPATVAESIACAESEDAATAALPARTRRRRERSMRLLANGGSLRLQCLLWKSTGTFARALVPTVLPGATGWYRAGT